MPRRRPRKKVKFDVDEKLQEKFEKDAAAMEPEPPPIPPDPIAVLQAVHQREIAAKIADANMAADANARFAAGQGAFSYDMHGILAAVSRGNTTPPPIHRRSENTSVPDATDAMRNARRMEMERTARTPTVEGREVAQRTTFDRKVVMPDEGQVLANAQREEQRVNAFTRGQEHTLRRQSNAILAAIEKMLNEG